MYKLICIASSCSRRRFISLTVSRCLAHDAHSQTIRIDSIKEDAVDQALSQDKKILLLLFRSFASANFSSSISSLITSLSSVGTDASSPSFGAR